MKGHGSEAIASCIFNLGTKRKWVVCFALGK